MIDKYVIDSSLWIEIERKNMRVRNQISPFIQNNQVCLVDLIIAEVLRGVKSIKDFTLLKEAFLNFTILKTDWLNVSELGFKLSKKGYHPPLGDLYIAHCVMQHKKILLTQDKDFLAIQRVFPKLSVEMIS